VLKSLANNVTLCEIPHDEHEIVKFILFYTEHGLFDYLIFVVIVVVVAAADVEPLVDRMGQAEKIISILIIF
jgi:hypothetical protein